MGLIVVYDGRMAEIEPMIAGFSVKIGENRVFCPAYGDAIDTIIDMVFGVPSTKNSIPKRA